MWNRKKARFYAKNIKQFFNKLMWMHLGLFPFYFETETIHFKVRVSLKWIYGLECAIKKQITLLKWQLNETTYQC